MMEGTPPPAAPVGISAGVVETLNGKIGRSHDPVRIASGWRFYRAGHPGLPKDHRFFPHARHLACAPEALSRDQLVSELFLYAGMRQTTDRDLTGLG
jgi:hypothetical protein